MVLMVCLLDVEGMEFNYAITRYGLDISVAVLHLLASIDSHKLIFYNNITIDLNSRF